MAARDGREPLRTCIGCRRVRPKSELIRLVLDDGTVAIDRTKTAPGRGAYVCPDRECFERAGRRSGKALRAQGTRWTGDIEETAKSR